MKRSLLLSYVLGILTWMILSAIFHYRSEPQAFYVPERVTQAGVLIHRVDADGEYFATGTAIGHLPGKTIILTCQHVLRGRQKNDRITVYFIGTGSVESQSWVIAEDDAADIALLAVKGESRPVCELGAKSAHKGDMLFSMGCSSAMQPVAIEQHVTGLNLYQGPDTIQCDNEPAKGRSGGGLFAPDGKLVGVCTNADPKAHRGVYAGLWPIQALVRKTCQIR